MSGRFASSWLSQRITSLLGLPGPLVPGLRGLPGLPEWPQAPVRRREREPGPEPLSLPVSAPRPFCILQLQKIMPRRKTVKK